MEVWQPSYIDAKDCLKCYMFIELYEARVLLAEKALEDTPDSPAEVQLLHSILESTRTKIQRLKQKIQAIH